MPSPMLTAPAASDHAAAVDDVNSGVRATRPPSRSRAAANLVERHQVVEARASA